MNNNHPRPPSSTISVHTVNSSVTPQPLSNPPSQITLFPETEGPSQKRNISTISASSSTMSSLPSQVSIHPQQPLPAYTTTHQPDIATRLDHLTTANIEAQRQITAAMQNQMSQLLNQNQQLMQQLINAQYTKPTSALPRNPADFPDQIDLLDTPAPIPKKFQSNDEQSIASSSEIDNFNRLVELFQNSSDMTKRISTFPKFSGKDFPAWYDSVISILASPGWRKLYDDASDDAILTEPNSDLSAELYTALKRCLQGDAQTTMINKKGMRCKGILFLRVLRATFNPKLSTLERDEKQREFLRITRNKGESIDSYGARCIVLREELEHNDISTNPVELRTRFIMGLGPEFTKIKQDLNEDNLPAKWDTLDMEKLFRVATAYLSTVMALRKQNQEYNDEQKKKQQQTDQKKPQ